MNLRSKIMTRLHSHFRITAPSQWSRVSAAEVLTVSGSGKSTLNKLRLHLAHRGISLRGDNPPAYWLDVLGNVGPDGLDKTTGFCVSGICPFTVIVDVNETFPFTFEAIDDREGNRVSVPMARRPLYQMGLADYTIHGMEELIQIERKGDDLPPSLSERRESFEAEIARLNDMCEFAAVVVEHPWRDILSDQHEHGARAKSISRTVQAWMVRYPGVHWCFCENRFHAEQLTFRLMERFWWDHMRREADQMEGQRQEIEETADIWAPI